MTAVIFDFDGLLMDTESTSLLSWEYEWSQWGLELDRATFFAPHGGDVSDQRYASLAGAVGPSFDRELSHRRRETYRDDLHRTLGLSAGIGAWLSEAAELGLHLAVASSSPLDWVTGHLARAGVGDAFEVVAAGNEVDDHKPAPDVYRLALTRLGILPGHGVAVEDTPHGVEAAHRAGLRAIAIPNPHVDPTRCATAELVLGSAAELTLRDALRKVG